MTNVEQHADKVGVVGSIVTALCCLGVPAVLSIVSALGLGFLIHDAILIPLLVLALGLTVWGLVQGRRRHGGSSALVLGLVSGVGLLLFSLSVPSTMLVVVSIAGLMAASVLNVLLARRRRMPAQGQPSSGVKAR